MKQSISSINPSVSMEEQSISVVCYLLGVISQLVMSVRQKGGELNHRIMFEFVNKS